MMTFTSEQLATLRKIAQQATQGEWRAFISPDTGTYAVHTPGDERCGDIIKWPGFDDQKNAENNAEFIAAFNPKLVLALLDERERNQQYIKRRDQENEDIALTVGKLRVELETAKSKLNEQREYYEGVISDGSKRIAKLESNEVREDGNQFLVVRHPGKTPVIKHCTGDLEEFLRQLIEQDPLVTIDIITHRYYGVGGQWVQDAGEYLHMMSDAGIRIKGE
ncbi:ead/Ea22-like family protein (plasmid) [Escherichia coli]|uniref:Ead/Ea22-like family protein n=1 Tax=Escherichia coli TaxID=562 RepID=A0AAV1ITV5_ECOLX|nr:ead/Ea22-like family protein [Escherichia coli]CAK1261219.1 ead/Ea22-like family protein [Escherichia coli]CAK1262296.1 ead/Ea22-like family protein [Escherichia coli]